MGPGLASARWKLRWYTGSGTTCGQNETSEDVVLSFFHHFPTKRKRDELTFVRSSRRKWFLFLSGIISLLSLSAPFFLSSTQFTPLLLFLFHPFTLFFFLPLRLFIRITQNALQRCCEGYLPLSPHLSASQLETLHYFLCVKRPIREFISGLKSPLGMMGNWPCVCVRVCAI